MSCPLPGIHSAKHISRPAAVWVFGHDPVSGGVSGASAAWGGVNAGDLAAYGMVAGDWDGDGADDLAIGAPRNSGGHGYYTGSVYLVTDPLNGGGSLSGADQRISGEAYEDLAGGDIANLGDWNGDGADDLLVGAAYSEQGASYGGAGYVVVSAMGVTDLSARTMELYGQHTYDRLGQSVAAVDLDGDGFKDALVGSYGYLGGGASAAGGVVAMYGPTSGAIGSSSADVEWVGDSSTAYLGVYQGVRNGGDVNGDGFDDVIMGASAGGFGVTYVVYGGGVSSGSIGAVADAILVGETSGDGAGGYLSGAGDVDNDGFGDLLIGAPSQGTGGRAYLVTGPVAGTIGLASARSFDGEASGDGLGQVASAGDQDGDGHPDLLIGAYASDRGATDAGAVYLIYGSSL